MAHKFFYGGGGELEILCLDCIGLLSEKVFVVKMHQIVHLKWEGVHVVCKSYHTKVEMPKYRKIFLSSSFQTHSFSVLISVLN